MEKPVIFLGPSLSRDKARKILDAEYRPPAKKGDFLTLASDHSVKLVGFVDGVFLQDYPPTPIEVYQLARKEGVVLAGAASLGALRAVELEKFGMIGIGTIFRLYKDGKLNADDEVAVTFAHEGGYMLQSEAMIDIRYNLFLAHKNGVIDKETKKAIAVVAKKTYFPERNYANIIKKASERFPPLSGTIETFGRYIAANRKSLKEIDAMLLLKFLKERYNESTNQ